MFISRFAGFLIIHLAMQLIILVGKVLKPDPHFFLLLKKPAFGDFHLALGKHGHGQAFAWPDMLPVLLSPIAVLNIIILLLNLNGSIARMTINTALIAINIVIPPTGRTVDTIKDSHFNLSEAF
ncbi:MAG: hypothetical protein KGI24_04960 [Candidatus Omnitrophica bacterium]|nr:hypothetical protein [Candidatus Omnitrophota bacterium]MDE2214331.1 hypothetical protein [Candidatus Omnitrophota bacterium]MDE2231080.1 hypothetical protein [Candidatus Omnitrophota bacterium]